MLFSKPLWYACLFCFLCSTGFAATPFSEIDERLLLNPDPLQITQENMGKVIIYERVREEIIHDALDTDFARIENMMFVNTVIE